MQNEIFTFGIGKVIASGYAMRNCIEFLKTAYLKPLAWIKENGIKYGKVIYINYEPRDQWMENLANEIDSVSTWILSKDFKYCFSGYNQFIVYRTKAEAKRYLKVNSSIHRIKDLLTITDELRQKISDTPRHNVFEIIDDVAVPLEIKNEVDQWFIKRAHEFKFHPFVRTCSMCFERDAFYVGVTIHGTPFEFCQQCRDQLQALKIERTQLPERFGV